MLESLQHTIFYYDRACWYYLNNQWHNDTFDQIIPFLRNQWTWQPLYLFLALYMPSSYGKSGWIWCFFFILCFACSDFVSASLLKPIFHRLRPCADPELATLVHNIVPCGGGYSSFPSSHASNHFTIGVFLAFTLGKLHKWVKPVAILWAALVAYSQVYVGVHFPLDVFCGALIGISIGTIAGKVFNKRFGLIKKGKMKTAG